MLFLFLLLGLWQNAGPAGPCQARLKLEQHGNLLTVTGHCRNMLPIAASYRYELAVLRESNGNRSQNTQSGAFNAPALADIALSQSTTNVGPQDVYSIHLRVLDMNGHTLAQDSAKQVSTH